MLTASEIASLITLLDDEDEEIVNHVKGKLLTLEPQEVSLLETAWSNTSDAFVQQQILDIIHAIQFAKLKTEFGLWYTQNQHDLLEGACLVARYKYPNLTAQEVLNKIDKIRLEVWLELSYDLSPVEKVNIINRVLYRQEGFKGNTENYHHPENSFINKVLETKRGNPILLSVVYLLLAQRLHLPVFGVNLPQHFVCVYKEEEHKSTTTDPFNLQHQLNYKEGRALFYLNPFNQGSVFTKANLQQFLKQLNMGNNPDYFEACSNLDIVKRMLRNLVVAYQQMQNEQSAAEIKELLLICGETYFSFNEEQPNEDDN